MVTACPDCGTRLPILREMLGKRGGCPACRTLFVIPSRSAATTTHTVGDGGRRPLVVTSRPPETVGGGEEPQLKRWPFRKVAVAVAVSPLVAMAAAAALAVAVALLAVVLGLLVVLGPPLLMTALVAVAFGEAEQQGCATVGGFVLSCCLWLLVLKAVVPGWGDDPSGHVPPAAGAGEPSFEEEYQRSTAAIYGLLRHRHPDVPPLEVKQMARRIALEWQLAKENP